MKLDHIAIVVRDLEQAVDTYTVKLGMPLQSRHLVASEGVEIAVLELDNAHIELVRPVDKNSGTARFLEKKGEGLHHICMEVDNIEKMAQSLEAAGIKLAGDKVRTGYKGNKALFVHPSSTNGVLIEFYEKSVDPVK